MLVTVNPYPNPARGEAPLLCGFRLLIKILISLLLQYQFKR
uniref:Uncharacterized protein n=1 Tax=Anguilla anguilla TaxID=7936 RepID=A0A0E9QYW8_ANGAN